MMGIPVVIHPWLKGPNEFYLLHEKEAFCSREAFRWLCIWSLAGGWPMRDLAAQEEDG